MRCVRRREADGRYPLGLEHFGMIEVIGQQDEAGHGRLAHEHTRMFHDRLLAYMRRISWRIPTEGPRGAGTAGWTKRLARAYSSRSLTSA